MVALPPSPPPPSSNISTVYSDVLQTHILTRLDGATLASLACASSELHTLSNDDQLWQKICTSTWPSISHPIINSVLGSFPSGHRSFFSDFYPLIHHHHHHHHHHSSCRNSSPVTTELFSAVDIYYQNVPIFSKVEKMETVSGWFESSPFRVDLLGPKEIVPTWVQPVGGADLWLHQLENNLTLSWIIIDPTLKRAMNISSQKPVSAQRHWLTGEIQVMFATILAGDGGRGSEKEYVKCEVVVTCGGKEGGEVHVRDLSLGMEDMDGKAVNGKDSLVILREAMEKGERRKLKCGEGKERFKGYLERKRERKEKLERKEKIWDWVCIATGVNCFLAFWSYMIFG